MKLFSIVFFKWVLLLILLAVFDQWLFTIWFNSSYPAWYVKNGSTIALLTAFISLTLGDLDKVGLSGLISPHPVEYIGACLQLISLSLYVIGAAIDKKKNSPDEKKLKTIFDRSTQKSEPVSNSNNHGIWFAIGELGNEILLIILTIFDGLISLLFVIAICALLIAWLVVVTPMQYLVYLVCGSFARQMKRANSRVVYKIDEGLLVVDTLIKDRPTPEGMQDLSISNKRIAITNLLATVLFFVLRIFI